MAEYKNTNRDFVGESYSDNKLDKSKELNDTMSIAPNSPDEYTRKINSGDRNNGE